MNYLTLAEAVARTPNLTGAVKIGFVGRLCQVLRQQDASWAESYEDWFVRNCYSVLKTEIK